MKKLLGIVVLGLLLSTNAYAEKRKSLFNFYFDLAESFILDSELTLEKIARYTTSEKEKKELIKLMNDRKADTKIEMMFTKEIMLDGGDNIFITTTKKYLTGEMVKKDIKKYCNDRLEWLKTANKDRKNKRTKDKEVIKNHKCLLVDIPAYVDFSVFESHLNLANNNIVVYQIQFLIPGSEHLITILLSCEKHCDEMLPVFERVVASTHFGKCIEGDCENGTGTIIYNDESKYIGEFKYGIENGQGTFITKDGKGKFIGQFLKGYINGYGKYIHEDGTEYNGEYKEGLTHGKGTWTYSDGNILKGTFKNGEFVN